MLTLTELRRRFNHRPPPDEHIAQLHAGVRLKVWELAEALNETLPAGREAALVQTKLEEALFWANAAIARNHELLQERASESDDG